MLEEQQDTAATRVSRAEESTGVLDRQATAPAGGGYSSGSSGGQVRNSATTPFTDLSTPRFVVFHEELGSGGFGTVYKGFDTTTGQYVAVKHAVIGLGAQGATTAQSLREEFDLLVTVDHSNIVKVFECVIDTNRGGAQIYMEWMPGGSLSDLISLTRFRLHELLVRKYTLDLLAGLSYLHSRKILHRDIKPANMLLSATGQVKLSDFGTSRQRLQDASSQGSSSITGMIVGTARFMAPESIKGNKYSAASDIWSFACSVLQLLSGELPWTHAIPSESGDTIPVIFCIGTSKPPDHHPPIPPHVSDPLRQILERCFSHDPAERPSADELLQLPYFASNRTPEDLFRAEQGVETLAVYQAASAAAREVFLARLGSSLEDMSFYSPTEDAGPPTGSPYSAFFPREATTGTTTTTGGAQLTDRSTANMSNSAGTTGQATAPPPPDNYPSPSPVPSASTVAGVKSKRDKLKPIVTPRSVWCYKKDNGRWMQYNLADSKILNQAYLTQQGRGKFELNMLRHNDKRTIPYEIDFDKMTQRNKRTHFVRDVKALEEGVLPFR